MLLDPPEGRSAPQELPHWPYVKAIDDALTAQRAVVAVKARTDADHRRE